MQFGAHGADVQELQLQLAAAGFDPGPADALFGPRTRRAVVQLQRCCRLAPDGRAGPQTLAALAMLLPHRPQPGRRLSPHFAETEFSCRCCGLVRVNPLLVHLLEQLRGQLGGKPVVVSSAYRCAVHNLAVGGAIQSQHLLGNAADIAVAGIAPRAVAAAAEKLSFAGVGRYSGFTHVDVRVGSKVRWVG